MLTDCKDCDAASKIMHHGFAVGCPGCNARAVARSPEFSEAIKTDKKWPGYLSLLGKMNVTHNQAKEAARNDRTCDKLMGMANET